MAGPIDLSQLPSPAVVEELEFETILAERKSRLLELTPEADRADVEATLELESEPITKLLEENAYREITWRQRVNEAARAVMLAYNSDWRWNEINGRNPWYPDIFAFRQPAPGDWTGAFSDLILSFGKGMPISAESSIKLP